MCERRDAGGGRRITGGFESESLFLLREIRETLRALLEGGYGSMGSSSVRQGSSDAGSIPAPSTSQDQLLNVKAAAERLGLSPDYLYRNAHRFSFTVRIGRSLRFSSCGIDEFIRQRTGRS